MSEPQNPFESLGTELKQLRELSNQSLAEVSGAVEIDEIELARIEAGFARPAEDVLLLLISYFGMKDNEAIKLWELAGYTSDIPEQLKGSDETLNGKNVVMVLAVDMRTVYSDSFTVVANQAGVVLNFAQTVSSDKTAPVARVGMSYEQAALVINELQQAMLKAKFIKGPRLLPPGDNYAQNE